MPRRVALAIGLFFLSPLVGEYLLGNIAIDAIPPLLFLGPMYGGGAVLVREAARHSGRGWPTMILLALAYAVVEEGLATPDPVQSVILRVRPAPRGVHPAHSAWVRGGRFSCSRCTPSGASPSRSHSSRRSSPTGPRPWLGRLGLAVVSVLFVLGLSLVFWGTYRQEQFLGRTCSSWVPPSPRSS